MELNMIYKIGNTTSHEEGLRLVYEKGRYDQRMEVSHEPIAQDLNAGEDKLPVVEQKEEDNSGWKPEGIEEPSQIDSHG